MTSIPGAVDPVSFAKARFNEVLLLKKDIEDGRFRGSRRVFQTLPRSMRRRAASYNIKRLPVRLRQKAIDEAAKDPKTAPKKNKKPPCRRRRRRPNNIQEEFGKRQQGNKMWLETHLWHAKRAHMENRWGYRIAMRNNEKCLKACLRASLKGCFLYDCSYFEIVEFGRSNDISRLRSAFAAEIYDNFDKVESVAKTLLCTTLSNREGQIIGPVFIICDEQAIRFAMHPLITMCFLELVGPDGVIIHKGEFSIFQMEGPSTAEILEKVLLLDDIVGVSQGNCQDPRFGALGVLSERLTSLWDVVSNVEALGRRKTDKALNEMRSKLAIPGTKLSPDVTDPAMPFGVYPYATKRLGKSCQTNRWLTIVPHGWGSLFWRCLVKQKVRFGSLMETKFVDAEHGRPFFPDDYANSSLFKVSNHQIAEELTAKWQRTPPAKRINYEKLGITSPFHIQIDTVQPSTTLYICRIECIGRGMPKYNARIWHNSKVVGYVTNGYYSQISGKGMAFATCCLPGLSNVNMVPIELEIQNLDGPRRSAKVVEIYFA